jgi:hypothetical protein
VRFVQIGILILLFSGCLSEPDCIDTSTNEVIVAFKVNSSTIREITFDSIQVSGYPKNLYEGSKVSSVSLPVNPSTNTTSFTLYFEKKIEDLTVTYSKTSQLLSPSCGAFLYYSNLKVKQSSFDSLIVVNNKLLTNATGNIEIYIE